ncbi:MAG: LPXTG cell wall anchor domain-containing protein [Phaeodactylibacter sp.]|nr:LPXTG cell wall anchor domain-containing protein [Phaeodactylibacter sp.]
MKELKRKVKKTARKACFLLASLLLFITELVAQAPEYGESPYSDQKFEGGQQIAWYQEPLLWVGLILLALVLSVIFFRRKRKYT